MAFCRFCLNLFHNLTKRSQNHPNLKHFGGDNLNHLKDTLGDLKPQSDFYQRDGVGGPH